MALFSLVSAAFTLDANLHVVLGYTTFAITSPETPDLAIEAGDDSL